MTLLLSTLSKFEKSRFEAFRKSALPADAIREYLAHLLLLNQYDHLAAKCRQTTGLLVGNASNCPNATTAAAGGRLGTGVPHLEQVMMKLTTQRFKKRPLCDLVQPNEADSIVVVVSALAKAYAQRLVTAARRVATVMAESNPNGNVSQQPLQAHHIQLAHEARVKAGVDPGFFLQPNTTMLHRRGTAAPTAWACPGKIAAAALGQIDRHELLRQAALQAQEEYDQRHDKEVGEPDENVTNDVIVEDMTQEDESHVATASIHDLVVVAAAPVDVEMNVEQPESITTSVDVEPQHDENTTAPPREEKPLSPPPHEAETIPMELDAVSPSALLSSSTTLDAATTSATKTEHATTLTVEAPLPDVMAVAAADIPVSTAPTSAPATTKSVPMSMEDALLLGLDDDSDSDSDDD